MLFKRDWANKLFLFIATFFGTFGLVVLILMLIVNVKPEVLELRRLWAVAAALFVNLGCFQILYKPNVSLGQVWVRRVLNIGQISFTTPLMMILFGIKKGEGVLLYFLLSAIAIQCVVLVIYLIADRQTTRATLNEINKVLKNNREE